MPTLTETQKRFIVGQLAAWSTPTEAAEAVKDEFGIEVPRQQVQHYDPTKAAGHDLAEKHVELFWELRQKFRDSVDEIGIANRAYQLKTLQDGIRDARRMRNWPLVRDLIETAESLLGGRWTSKRQMEHSGPEGGPIETKETFDWSQLSTETLRRIDEELGDD